MFVWIDIGSIEDFPVGEPRELVVNGQMVAVCHTEIGLHALDGVCPHQGGPLGNGTLDGCILTCPWHGWQFDVRDGQSLLSPHVKHTTIALRVADGRVLAEIATES